MTTTSSTPVENYRHILSQEKAWAGSVAGLAVKTRPFSVWEVLIPVLLIINFMKTKTDREVFIKNLLFTKELALREALDMAETGKTKQAALSSIEDKTRGLLETVDPRLYSEDIRRCQMQEMDFLMDHYLRLLQAEGKDFPALVRAAYPNREGYLSFLQGLGDLEKQVNGAALKTLGSSADPALVSRMEEASDGIRRTSAKGIFGAEDDAPC